MVGGEGDIIYLSLHCHHQNGFCIKMGSDESRFNVSVGSDGQSHKTVSTNHNLFDLICSPLLLKSQLRRTRVTLHELARHHLNLSIVLVVAVLLDFGGRCVCVLWGWVGVVNEYHMGTLPPPPPPFMNHKI